jgi:hypothetical protein
VPFVADPFNQPRTVTGGATGRQTLNIIDLPPLAPARPATA